MSKRELRGQEALDASGVRQVIFFEILEETADCLATKDIMHLLLDSMGVDDIKHLMTARD